MAHHRIDDRGYTTGGFALRVFGTVGCASVATLLFCAHFMQLR